ncbi:uncharacterized protein [Ptychodera flava]|uniref:uncharacterized protein n=1 Tax=Ptychodera flava TaxID=63121 RepID=UPI003969C6A7
MSREFVRRRLGRRLGCVVGMEDLKIKVEKLAVRAINNRARSKIKKQVEEPLNLLFYGPPGTGKTMFARLLAGCLYDVGILKEEKVVEIQRDNVVAQYVGESEKKMKKRIEDAAGGMMFIDEAYSLFKGKSTKDFGVDIINTLMHYLNGDSMRDTPVFVLAGYKAEMEKLLSANEGLLRRFREPWIFKPYTSQTLKQIVSKKLLKQGFHFESDLDSDIISVIDSVPSRVRSQLNAGLCGRIVDYIKDSIDERVCDPSDITELFLVKKVDICNVKEKLSVYMESVTHESLNTD